MTTEEDQEEQEPSEGIIGHGEGESPHRMINQQAERIQESR